MEQLIITARNIRVHLPDNDKERVVEPEIEAVLTTMERSIEFVGASYANVEKMRTIRFTLNPEAARKFAQSLNEWAQDAEDKADEIKEALKLLEKENAP